MENEIVTSELNIFVGMCATKRMYCTLQPLRYELLLLACSRVATHGHWSLIDGRGIFHDCQNIRFVCITQLKTLSQFPDWNKYKSKKFHLHLNSLSHFSESDVSWRNFDILLVQELSTNISSLKISNSSYVIATHRLPFRNVSHIRQKQTDNEDHVSYFTLSSSAAFSIHGGLQRPEWTARKI